MPRFSVRWLEIAIEYYDALPAVTRQQIDARVEQLWSGPKARRRRTTPAATGGPAPTATGPG
ncbi:MAG: hypothetical protein ACRDUV_08475 [Pseudonocardiaceae bacterium]